MSAIPKLTGLVLAATFALSAARAEPPETGWQLAKMNLVHHGENERRGYVIYTVDTERPGAAFRCDDGKMFAAFSLRPIPLRRYMTHQFTRPRDVEMSVQVGDDETRTETWVSVFNGKLYMPRSRSTTSELFRAVASGRSVLLARTGKESHPVNLPAADDAKFGSFLRSCDLNPPNFPYPDGESPFQQPPADAIVARGWPSN